MFVSADTVMVRVRVTDPHGPPLATSVTTSVPVRVASYLADPEIVPDEGEIEFAREDVNFHDVAPLMPMLRFALPPCFSDDGPFSVAVLVAFSVTSATDSSPTPHALLARPEKIVLAATFVTRLPAAGRNAPMPSIETVAEGIEACHETVMFSPPQTLPCDAEIVSEGRTHTAGAPGARTARLREWAGGGVGRISGEKSIAINGCNARPFGAAPR